MPSTQDLVFLALSATACDIDMCTNICINIGIGRCVCIDMCIDRCKDIVISICTDMRRDMCLATGTVHSHSLYTHERTAGTNSLYTHQSLMRYLLRVTSNNKQWRRWSTGRQATEVKLNDDEKKIGAPEMCLDNGHVYGTCVWTCV